MQSLLQTFKSGKKIKGISELNIIKSYYEYLKAPRTTMQYNQGFMWYLTGAYHIAEYKECLLIYKAKPFLNFIIFILECPPISKNSDYLLEKDIINEARGLGVNCRMTELEVPLYSFDIKELEKVDSSWGDFVYSCENLKLDGKKFEQDRSAINRINKNPDITVDYYTNEEYESMFKLKAELHNCADLWKSNKAESGRKTDGSNFHLHEYIDLLDKTIEGCALVIRHKGKVVAYSISEYLGAGNISMPDRKICMWDIPSMHQAFRAVNYFEIKYWRDKLQRDDLICQFGSAGDSKTLYETKRRMNPLMILKNLKFSRSKGALQPLHPELEAFAKPTKKGIF